MYLRETTCRETNPLATHLLPPFANPLNAYLPSTLHLQDRLSGPSNRDILEKSALRLELNPRGGDKCLRPKGGIDGPALLHGHLYNLKIRQCWGLIAIGEIKTRTVVRKNRERADGAQRDWLLDLTLDWRKSFSRVQATGPR